MNESRKIYITEKLLIRIINESNLSIGTMYFLLKDLTNQFKELYEQEGQKQIELQRQSIKKQQQQVEEEKSSTSQD